MSKPHTKVIEKIRKSVDDGVKELKKVEAPKPLIDKIEKIKTSIDWVEQEIKRDWGN